MTSVNSHPISTQSTSPCPELQQARTGMKAVAARVGNGCQFGEIASGKKSGLYLYKDTNGNGTFDVNQDQILLRTDSPDCESITHEVGYLGGSQSSTSFTDFTVVPEQSINFERLATEKSYQAEIANWVSKLGY